MNEKQTIIYTADIAPLENKALFDAVYALVSDARREKTGLKSQPNDKRLSLGAEYLLMQACKDFGLDYKTVKIKTAEHSKPDFDNCPFHFNLSHSEEKVMCAVSPFTIGCDTEKILHREHDIAHRYFTYDECLAIEECTSDDEKNRMFYRLWTLKESFMKCTGLGFHLSLSSFSVNVNCGQIKVKQNVDTSQYFFCEKDYDDGYKYSACLRLPEAYSGENPDILWKKIEIR